MFGSFGAGFGSFGSGVGGLFPSLTYLISWLKTPTADGKTLANSKGTDADLTDVNCLQFSNNNGQFVALPVETPFAVGVILSADIVVTGDSGGVAEAMFGEDSNHCFGVTAGGGDRYPRFRANLPNNYIEFTNITVSENTPYNIKWERTAAAEVVCTVVDLVTNTTQTQTANNFAGQQELYLNQTQIREIGRSDVNIDSHIKIANAKVGDYFYPLQEGSGTTAYDISGNGNHGTITGATWSTADGFESWNHEYGFDASAVFDTGDYIQTGVTASYDHSIEATFRYTGDTSLDRVLFGVRDSSRDFYFGLQGGEWRCARSAGGVVDVGTADNSVHKITISADGVFTLSNEDGSNPIELANITHPTYTFTRDYYINGRNIDGSPNKLADVEFYSFKIMNGSTTVLDYNFIENDSTEDYNLIRYPALNTKTKQVATFDGVDDRLDFTAHTTAVGDVFDFEFDLVSNADGAEGNHRCLLSNRVTKYIALLDNDNGRIVVRGDSIQTATGTIKVADGMSTLKVTVDSASQVSVSINGGAAETLSTDFTGVALDRLMASGASNLRYLNANVKSFSITNSSGTKVVDYDFQSDIGTTTVQDLSTNDNDGDLTVGSGGTETFWGTRVADASGSLVSADYATGNTSISNPAGFVHNNSECGVKLQSRTVGTFDGSDDRVDFNHNLVDQQDFVVEWEGIMGAVSNNDAFWSLFDDSGSNRGSYIRYEHTNTKIFARIGSQSINSSSITLAENDVIKLTTTISNSGTKASAVIVVNGVTTNLFTNQTLNTAPQFDGTGKIGRLTPISTSQFKGKVSSFKITQGGVDKVEYDFSEGQGTTLTDLSGNGNNGTIVVGASGIETFWADSYQEYEKIDLDQGFVPAQITVTDCTDTSLNGLYELDSTRNNEKLRWLKNNNTVQKVYFNSGSNRWTIQDSGGSVTKIGDTILPAEGSYDGGANLAYSTQGVFIKTSGTNITQIGQYDGDEILTATEATQNDRYFG